MKTVTRYFSFIGQVDCIETKIKPSLKNRLYEVGGDNWGTTLYSTIHPNIMVIENSNLIQDWDRETKENYSYWEFSYFLAKKTGFYINPAVPVEKYFSELETALKTKKHEKN